MLGLLPDKLKIGTKDYAIRADFRNILRIFQAFNDKDLNDREKVIICLKRLFLELEQIPSELYQDAYEQAIKFIEGQIKGSGKAKVVDWDKDEQLIFPAINKVAGMEVRSIPFLHWWTFLGYFQTVDSDDLWGYVLHIRQKRAKGKKLEKHEQEFFNANRELVLLEPRKAPEDSLQEIFKSLLEGGSR